MNSLKWRPSIFYLVFVSGKFLIDLFLRSNGSGTSSTYHIESIESRTGIQTLVLCNGYHFDCFFFDCILLHCQTLYEDSSIYKITASSDGSNCNATDKLCLNKAFILFSEYVFGFFLLMCSIKVRNMKVSWL